MQETILKIRYFERWLSKKPLKKLTWVFPFHPVPFYQQYSEKLKGHGTSYQSLQNMSRKIPFLVIYYLGNFDDLTQSGF